MFAKENAKKKKVKCNFLITDVVDHLMNVVKKTFDFAYDWEVLHHIFPRKGRNLFKTFMKFLIREVNIYRFVFNEKDTQFGGLGKFRNTNLGTVLYFSLKKSYMIFLVHILT